MREAVETMARGRQPNHPFDYLVMFNRKDRLLYKLVINASNESQALRIGCNKLLRVHPDVIFSRARIAGVYPNKRCSIKKTTGKGLF